MVTDVLIVSTFCTCVDLFQAHDVDTAINAFTRSVQLDPDNGESWNNLAAL